MTCNRAICSFLTVLWAFSVLITPACSDDEAPKKNPQPKIVVAKDVTYFTKPIDKDGYVDLAAAINTHMSQGVTAKNNACVLLYRVFGPAPDGVPQPDKFFELLGMQRPAKEGAYFQTMSAYHKRSGQQGVGPVWDKFVDEQGRSGRPWKTGDLPIVHGWIQANEAPMKLVAKAVELPYHYSPLVVPRNENGESSGLIAVLLPGIQSSRGIARLLLARSMNHLGEGRHEESWRDLMSLIKLGRLIAQGPTLIEALVGIAIEGIAQQGLEHFVAVTKPNSKQAAKCITELDAIDKKWPIAQMADKIEVTERAMFIDCTLMIARGTTKMDELVGIAGNNNGLGSFAEKFATGLVDWNTVLRNGNKWYDRMAKIIRIADARKRKAEIAVVEKEISQLAKDARDPLNMLRFLDPKKGRQAASEYMTSVLISLLLPAVHAAKDAEDRLIQKTRFMRLSLALSAHKVEHGDFPETLKTLKMKVPTTDIFNSEATVKYSKTKNGFIAYSVGRNGKDEQGRWHSDDEPGDDISIRYPVRIEK